MQATTGATGHRIGNAGNGLTHGGGGKDDAAFPFDDFGLPVERLMVEVFIEHHAGDELRAEKAALYNLRRRRCGDGGGIRLVQTHIGGPHEPLPDKTSGDALKPLHHFLADTAPALRRGLHAQRDDDGLFHRQIFGQQGGAHFSSLAAAAFGLGREPGGCGLDDGLLHGQFQIHLPGDGRGRLFTLPPEDLPHQQSELPLRVRELFLQFSYALFGSFQFVHGICLYAYNAAGPGKCFIQR